MALQFPAAVERWRPVAAKYMPPELVDKLLWTINFETGGRPDAIGDNGVAIGLLQVQDNTRFPGRPSKQQLLDPEFNIRYAAEQLGAAQGNFAAWGENNLYQGKPFGALGHHPFPGQIAPPQTPPGGRPMASPQQDTVAQGRFGTGYDDLTPNQKLAVDAVVKEIYGVGATGAGASETAQRWTGNGPQGYGTYVLNADNTPGQFIGNPQAPASATEAAPKGGLTEAQLVQQGAMKRAPGVYELEGVQYRIAPDGTYAVSTVADAGGANLTGAELASANTATAARNVFARDRNQQGSTNPQGEAWTPEQISPRPKPEGAYDRRSTLESQQGLPEDVFASLMDVTSKTRDLSYNLAAQQAYAEPGREGGVSDDIMRANYGNLIGQNGLLRGAGLKPSGNMNLDYTRGNETLAQRGQITSQYPNKSPAFIADVVRDLNDPRVGAAEPFHIPGDPIGQTRPYQDSGPLTGRNRQPITKPGFDYTPDEIYELYNEGKLIPSIPSFARGGSYGAGSPLGRVELQQDPSYDPRGGGSTDWIRSPGEQVRLHQGRRISDRISDRWEGWPAGPINDAAYWANLRRGLGRSDDPGLPGYNPYPRLFPGSPGWGAPGVPGMTPMADGGQMMTDEPVVGMGAFSQEPKFIAGEAGPEMIDFTPTGPSPLGGAGMGGGPRPMMTNPEILRLLAGQADRRIRLQLPVGALS